MSYHAIGKQVWDELPSMFSNTDLAETLEEDQTWWAYSYMFPHKFRTEVIDGNTVPLTCGMDAMIKFRKSDGVFKKVLRPMD